MYEKIECVDLELLWDSFNSHITQIKRNYFKEKEFLNWLKDNNMTIAHIEKILDIWESLNLIERSSFGSYNIK